MKRGKKPCSGFELDSRRDDIMRRAAALLSLVIAGLENDHGTGIADFNRRECSDLACLCSDVQHELTEVQDAVEVEHAAPLRKGGQR